MKAVFVADSPAEAHLVAGLLDEAGIRNVVEGEMLFGVRADIGLTPASLPRICVNDEDVPRAVEVLRSRAPESSDVDETELRDDAVSKPRPWGRATAVAVLCIVVLAVAIRLGAFVLLPVAAVALLVGAFIAAGRRS